VGGVGRASAEEVQERRGQEFGGRVPERGRLGMVRLQFNGVELIFVG